MRKRFRDRWLVNLGLLMAISGLLALSLPEEEAARAPVLSDFLPAAATELRILRPGSAEIHFKLHNGYWQMLAPYQTRADDALIKQLLSLPTLEVSAILSDPGLSRADFGLHKPVVTVQLNEQHLNFGNDQPVSRQRYIELDNKIMLIPDRHMAPLMAGGISYVDRHLLPPGTRVQSLNIDGKTVDPAPWLSTKAHWLSAARETRVRQGIDVRIKLNNGEQSAHYIAEKRQAGLVLTNMQSKLEYHLPATAAKALGLPFCERQATQAPSNVQSQ